MPDFVKAYEANKDKIVMIGINMNDEPQEVADFTKEFKMNFPVTIDNTGDLTAQFRVPARPTTYFINKSGVFTAITVGSTSAQRLEQEIAKALK